MLITANSRKVIENIKHTFKENSYINACRCCVLCFALIYIYPGWRLDTGDDALMDNIAAGLQTNNPSFIIYSNVIWGYIISSLYKLVPCISWYVTSQVLLIVITTIVFFSANLKKMGFFYGTLINYLLGITIGLECICKINFTRTSGFIIALGLYLLLDSFQNPQRKNIFRKIFCTILIIIGSLIRFQVLLIVMPIFLFFNMYLFVCKDNKLAYWQNNHSKEIILIVLFITISIIATFGYDKHYRTSNQLIQRFSQMNYYRSKITDYPIYEYDKIASKLSNSNFSKNDYEMISRSLVCLYTAEQLKEFYKISHIPSMDNFLHKYNKYKLLAKVVDILCANYLSVLNLVLAGILFSILPWKYKILLGLLISMEIAYILLFLFLGRVVDRVLFVVYFCTFLSLMFLSFNIFSYKYLPKCSVCHVLSFYFLIFLLFNLSSPLMTLKHPARKSMKDFIIAISQRTDNFYLLAQGKTTILFPDRLLTRSVYFDKLPMNYHKMYSVMGIYPFNNNIIHSYQNTPNPFNIHSVVDSEIIRYVDCGDINLVIEFLNQRRSSKVEAHYVETICGYKTYKISSVENGHQ